MKFVRDLDIRGKDFWSSEDGAHVGVEMRRVNSQCYSALHLRANLTFSIFGLGMLSNLRGVAPECSYSIKQAGNSVGRCERTPAIHFPFACEREVQAKIRIRMRVGVGGNFRDPRAWDHDAGGSDNAFLQRVKACRIYRVRNGEIVRMDDEQF